MNTKAKNLDCYGTPPIDWERVRDVLTSEIRQGPDEGGPNRHTVWLTTINPDGSPHLTPVGSLQLDGVWYFTSGPGTRKSRNIAGAALCRQRSDAPLRSGARGQRKARHRG
jgi:hypothetical protein